MTQKVALEGIEIHAFHGVYPHELISGNWFEIDISVDTDFGNAARTDELDETVNYEALFRIVKEEMEIPSKLLETVAEKIVNRVITTFPSVKVVEFKISKLNPPIGGKCRKASVSLTKQR